MIGIREIGISSGASWLVPSEFCTYTSVIIVPIDSIVIHMHRSVSWHYGVSWIVVCSPVIIIIINRMASVIVIVLEDDENLRP